MKRGLLLAVAVLLGWSGWAGAAERPLAFDIFRKGELIGSHVIAFKPEGEALEVAVDIRLLVKLLFVPVYRYEHRNRELWQGDRLLRIDSRTDDNGEELSVRGIAGPDGFKVQAGEDSYVAPLDVISTSWWNFATVKRRKLLNSQKGELMAVSVTRVGEEQVETAAGPIPATHYVVDGEAKLELWYDGEERLAKIRFAGSDGAPIEYRRRD